MTNKGKRDFSDLGIPEFRLVPTVRLSMSVRVLALATAKRSERCEMCDGGSQANAAGTGCGSTHIRWYQL